MKFERGLNPKQAMGVGLAKDATEIEGMVVKGLCVVFEKEVPWTILAFPPSYNQVGETQITIHLEGEDLHYLLNQMTLGWSIKPILDEWLYNQFKKEQYEQKKYTSQRVARDCFKVLYRVSERSRHTDTGIHMKTKDRLWDKIYFLSGHTILYDGKFYNVPEDIQNEF